MGCFDWDSADKSSLVASTDSTHNLGMIHEAGGARQMVPAPSINLPKYPYGSMALPLNLNVGGWVKLASLVQFFLAIRLYVLYSFLLNPFFSCFNSIDYFFSFMATK